MVFLFYQFFFAQLTGRRIKESGGCFTHKHVSQWHDYPISSHNSYLWFALWHNWQLGITIRELIYINILRSISLEICGSSSAWILSEKCGIFYDDFSIVPRFWGRNPCENVGLIRRIMTKNRVETFKIHLQEKGRTFYPGEAVNGQVILKIKKYLKLRELRLECHGEANVNWPESTGTYTHYHHNKEQYFHAVSVISGQGLLLCMIRIRTQTFSSCHWQITSEWIILLLSKQCSDPPDLQSSSALDELRKSTE